MRPKKRKSRMTVDLVKMRPESRDSPPRADDRDEEGGILVVGLLGSGRVFEKEVDRLVVARGSTSTPQNEPA